MPAPVEKADVVSALRESRDKLNHGGRHWIKGALKRWVTKHHRPGAHGLPYRDKGSKHSEQAYCSVGALDNIKGNVQTKTKAKVALAEVIDKKKYEDLRDTGCSERHAAEAVIIPWNDAPKRQWPEVKDAFTRAARRVSQRKG